MLLYEWQPLKVSHHPKFGGHRHSRSEDIMFVSLSLYLSKSHVTLSMGTPHGKLPAFQVWWP